MQKVTLAIPIFNVEKYVKNSIISALNQTYKNIEYVIIDDKSTDNSMIIVNEIISQYSNKREIRIIDHITNKGLGDTRNTAITEATGEYIYFMDSDDIISPNCIEILMKYMEETPVDFIASSRCRKTFEGKLIANDIYTPALVIGNKELEVARFRYVNNNKILAEVWNKLYNLEFLRKNHIKCIPGVHVEDVSFSYQVNLAARSCRLVPDITYTYHIYNEQSFSAFKNNKSRADYLVDCFRKIKEYDLTISNKYKERKEYGAILTGILNVSLVHARMVYKSPLYSIKEKQYIISELLEYPLSLKELLELKSKRRNNLLFYLICNLPSVISNSLLHRFLN